MTALTGTLIGDAVQRGQTELMVELGVLRPHEIVGPSIGTGVFGGYLYMNGSAMRLFGVRMPGMSARDADEQVMGEVTDLPPYRPAKGDRNLRASLAVSRYVLTMLRSPDLAPARARPRRGQGVAGDDARRRHRRGRAAAALARHVPAAAGGEHEAACCSFSGMAAAPRGLLDRFLDRPGVPAGLANRIVSGTGDVDSAQLPQRLWTLGRLVAGDPALSADVRRGARGHRHPHARTRRLQPAVDAFLAEYGHRGSDEYELATPAWVMDPAPVYAAIDRLRHAPEHRDPAVAASSPDG